LSIEKQKSWQDINTQEFLFSDDGAMPDGGDYEKNWLAGWNIPASVTSVL
jgi:hypothetical protein